MQHRVGNELLAKAFTSNVAREHHLASLKARAKQLKQQTLTVYYTARDRRTPLYVRALAFLIAAYTLSPVDLIPDFIPVLGYLDDLLLIPLGLALVVGLTPPEVLGTTRAQAKEAASKPVSYTAAAFIVLLWLVALWLTVRRIMIKLA